MRQIALVLGFAAMSASGSTVAQAAAPSSPAALIIKQRPSGSHIRPGRHQCQLSAEYRFRPCTVMLDGGLWLSFPGGLMGVQGRLVRRGETYVFTGRITDDEPLICASVERHLPDYARLSAQCRQQPLTAVLRRGRNGWTGRLTGLRELQAVYANDRPAGERQRAVSHRLAPYSSTAIPLTINH